MEVLLRSMAIVKRERRSAEIVMYVLFSTFNTFEFIRLVVQAIINFYYFAFFSPTILSKSVFNIQTTRFPFQDLD